MSRSTHQFEIKGVDKSAGAFYSIKTKAAATSAQIRSMVGGAIAAAGAYMGFSAIKGGIDQLGRLSDIALKTSTNVGELTGAVSAMGALGIQNMSVERFAKSFDFLAKTTGRSGMEGFYRTIEDLAKIEDVAKRGQEAMRIFGDSGMEFMPLINAADTSVDALRTVINAMPMVPQAAADAGDAMSDAMGFAANQIQSIWLQGLGAICGWLDNEYTGGVREASLTAGNYLEYYTKIAVTKCIAWYQKLQSGLKVYGNAIGTFLGAAAEKVFGSGGTWSEVWKQTTEAWNQSVKECSDTWQEIEAVEDSRTDRFTKAFEARKIAIEKFQGAYNKAATSIKGRESKNGGDLDVAKQTKISNDLIMGGSNAATRMQILGPTLQTESKRQTTLLEKIATNTEKTADNTEETAKAEDSVGVID